MDALKKAAEKYKYLMLLLVVGVVLLTLPAGTDGGVSEGTPSRYTSDEEERLEQVLSTVEGVGAVSVLYSEEGVAVICEGADRASVRLAVTEAVGAYTGHAVNEISVIKMKTT